MKIKTKIILIVLFVLFCIAIALAVSNKKMPLNIGTGTIDMRLPIVALLVLIIGFTMYYYIGKAKKKTAQILSSALVYDGRAKVFAKTLNTTQFGSTYYVSFVLPDGTRKNIRVNVEQYNTMTEGEEGILNYKEITWNETSTGKEIRFIDFQPTLQDTTYENS